MQKVVETKASFFYFYRLKEGNFCLSDICDASNLKSEQPTQTLDVKNSIGTKGLKNIFTFKEVNSANSYITDFEYKKPIYEKYEKYENMKT